MKKYLIAFAALACSTGLFAQQSNSLLEADFWKKNPDVAAVKAEVGSGNSVSDMNRMSFDPTILAMMNGASDEVIKYLIDQNTANLNKPFHDGRSYIFWAGMKGNVSIVKYLIGKGVDLNMEDSHGATPLSFSTNAEGSLPVIKALIEAGADYKKTYQNGANLLLVGIGNDTNLELTDYLISKGLSLQSTDKSGATAFDYAAKAGNLTVMKKLRERNVKFSNQSLLLASEGTRRGIPSLEVFEYLVGLGIKPTVTDADGKNVLHNILKRPEQDATVTYFISKGVSINQADKEGVTPFMVACESNKDTKLITQLLPSVKDINQPNNAGVTPLMLAVKGNTSEVVSLLIEKGASVQAKDKKGNSVAYYLVESFARGGRGGGGPMPGGPGGPGGAPGGPGGGPGAGQGPMKDEFAAKLTVLQSKGVDFKAAQEDGNSLLYIATAKDNLPLLKKLQGLGIDVNAKNTEGMTALHKAALLAKDDTVLKYLISIGADKSIKDDMDETAYDLAKDNSFLAKKNISVDFLK